MEWVRPQAFAPPALVREASRSAGARPGSGQASTQDDGDPWWTRLAKSQPGAPQGPKTAKAPEKGSGSSEGGGPLAAIGELFSLFTSSSSSSSAQPAVSESVGSANDDDEKVSDLSVATSPAPPLAAANGEAAAETDSEDDAVLVSHGPKTGGGEGKTGAAPRLFTPLLASSWIADSAVTACQSCGVAFTPLFRRHHCRCCGQVVCSNCSRRRRRIPNHVDASQLQAVVSAANSAATAAAAAAAAAAGMGSAPGSASPSPSVATTKRRGDTPGSDSNSSSSSGTSTASVAAAALGKAKQLAGAEFDRASSLNAAASASQGASQGGPGLRAALVRVCIECDAEADLVQRGIDPADVFAFVDWYLGTDAGAQAVFARDKELEETVARRALDIEKAQDAVLNASTASSSPSVSSSASSSSSSKIGASVSGGQGSVASSASSASSADSSQAEADAGAAAAAATSDDLRAALNAALREASAAQYALAAHRVRYGHVASVALFAAGAGTGSDAMAKYPVPESFVLTNPAQVIADALTPTLPPALQPQPSPSNAAASSFLASASSSSSSNVGRGGGLALPPFFKYQRLLVITPAPHSALILTGFVYPLEGYSSYPAEPRVPATMSYSASVSGRGSADFAGAAATSAAAAGSDSAPLVRFRRRVFFTTSLDVVSGCRPMLLQVPVFTPRVLTPIVSSLTPLPTFPRASDPDSSSSSSASSSSGSATASPLSGLSGVGVGSGPQSAGSGDASTSAASRIKIRGDEAVRSLTVLSMTLSETTSTLAAGGGGGAQSSSASTSTELALTYLPLPAAWPVDVDPASSISSNGGAGVSAAPLAFASQAPAVATVRRLSISLAQSAGSAAAGPASPVISSASIPGAPATGAAAGALPAGPGPGQSSSSYAIEAALNKYPLLAVTPPFVTRYIAPSEYVLFGPGGADASFLVASVPVAPEGKGDSERASTGEATSSSSTSSPLAELVPHLPPLTFIDPSMHGPGSPSPLGGGSASMGGLVGMGGASAMPSMLVDLSGSATSSAGGGPGGMGGAGKSGGSTSSSSSAPRLTIQIGLLDTLRSASNRAIAVTEFLRTQGSIAAAITAATAAAAGSNAGASAHAPASSSASASAIGTAASSGLDRPRPSPAGDKPSRVDTDPRPAAAGMLINHLLSNARTKGRALADACDRIRALSRVAVSAESPEHRAKLALVWRLFVDDTGPEPEMPRDVAWKRMGFQSENPFTDFRGMGVLTLECLIHLGRKNPAVARRLIQLQASREYPFAASAINVVAMAVGLIGANITPKTAADLQSSAPPVSPGDAAAAASLGIASGSVPTAEHPALSAPLAKLFCRPGKLDAFTMFLDLTAELICLVDILSARSRAGYMQMPLVMASISLRCKLALKRNPFTLADFIGLVFSGTVDDAVVYAPAQQ